MFLKQFVGDGTPQRIEVQTNCSTLLFRVITYHDKAIVDPILSTPGKTVADFLLPALKTLLSGNITVSRYSSSGVTTLYNNIPFYDLMEICSFGRSLVKHTNITGLVTYTGYYTYETLFSLPLSNFGSIFCDKSNFMVFEYTNPISNSNPLIQSVFSVNAVASYTTTSGFLVIDNLTAQDNQTTNFDCIDSFLIVVPATTSKLRVDSQSGETLELKDTELPIVQLMTSDFTHQINGIQYPSKYWFGVDCMQGYRGTLLNTTKTPFYLLSNKQK